MFNVGDDNMLAPGHAGDELSGQFIDGNLGCVELGGTEKYWAGVNSALYWSVNGFEKIGKYWPHVEMIFSWEFPCKVSRLSEKGTTRLVGQKCAAAA